MLKFIYFLFTNSLLFRQQQAKFSNSQKFVGDQAYVGAARTTISTKKPKGKELTPEQQEDNRQISRQRILIEHLIRRHWSQLKEIRKKSREL